MGLRTKNAPYVHSYATARGDIREDPLAYVDDVAKGIARVIDSKVMLLDGN
jgi:hypothetical protein